MSWIQQRWSATQSTSYLVLVLSDVTAGNTLKLLVEWNGAPDFRPQVLLNFKPVGIAIPKHLDRYNHAFRWEWTHAMSGHHEISVTAAGVSDFAAEVEEWTP